MLSLGIRFLDDNHISKHLSLKGMKLNKFLYTRPLKNSLTSPKLKAL